MVGYSSTSWSQTTNTLQLTWDASTDSRIDGYYVYSGTAHGTYSKKVWVGNVTNTTISGLTAGVTYYYAATALSRDGLESIFSNELIYGTPSSVPPTVALTTPVGGASYTAPANLVLAANVVSNGNIITKVQFYTNGVFFAARTVSPYSYTWTNAAAGTYSLTARAFYGSTSYVSSASALVSVVSAGTQPSVVLTAPATGGSYLAPASITLSASVVTNGHTINKVQFFNGTTLIGEDSTVAYTMNWSGIPEGNYALSAKVVYDTTKSMQSSTAEIVVTNLPVPWLTLDIGNTGLKGSASVGPNIFSVIGAGVLNGTADGFRFLYQPVGSVPVIGARMSSAQLSGTSGCVGIMLRETLLPGSAYAFLGLSSNGLIRLQARTVTGGATISTNFISSAAVLPNYWLALSRFQNSVYCQTSPDNTNWTVVSLITLPMSSAIYAGFVAASGSTNTVSSAVFADLALKN